MKKAILASIGLLISVTCFADRLGTEGATQTFEAEFDKVWTATLVALDDKTMDQVNKEIGQITTKAEKGHNLTGETSKTIAVKISHTKPCKVVVHANIERTTQGSGFGAGVSRTSVYSDDDLEKEILKSIEKNLSSQK